MRIHDIRMSDVTDIGELKTWEGTHKDLLHKPLIIYTATPRETQYGLAYICEVFVLDEIKSGDDEPVKYLMGATAIVNQIEDFQEHLPLAVKVEMQQPRGSGDPYYMLKSLSEDEQALYLDTTKY